MPAGLAKARMRGVLSDLRWDSEESLADRRKKLMENKNPSSIVKKERERERGGNETGKHSPKRNCSGISERNSRAVREFLGEHS